MAWEVEFTDEFGEWWDDLTGETQDAIDQVVRMLRSSGPNLRFPFSSGIQGSKHGHMRELRIQINGEPYRVFYAFDPRRAAMLLIGGNKGGDDRFYDRMIPQADRIYDQHISEIQPK